MGIYVAYYAVITLLYIFIEKYKFCFFPKFGAVTSGKADKNKQMMFFMTVSAAFLILILAFRSEYNGLDLHNASGTGYFFYYDSINRDSFLEILENFSKQKYANFEIGFVLFCKILGTICDNHQIMLLGCAVMSIIPMAYFIYKNSKNAWLSMMLFMALPFFGPAYFSAIRQGIAIGFVMLSFEFIKRKKLVWFILIVCFACLFHSSAVVAFIAYPVYYFRIDRESLMIGGLGILAMVFLLRMPLFMVLSRIVANNAEIVTSNAINLFMILTFLYIICVSFGNSEDENMRGLRNIFWLACASQAFGGVNNLAGRVSWYFMPTIIILLPNLITDMLIKEKTIRKPVIYLLGILAGVIGLKFLKSDMVALAYPYVPFWR